MWRLIGICLLCMLMRPISAAQILVLGTGECTPLECSLGGGGTIRLYRLGQPFRLFVYATDEQLRIDTSYTGTVSLSSSDPTSVLSTQHTFTPGDAGVFATMVVFNTLGKTPSPYSDHPEWHVQTVTAFDPVARMSSTGSFIVFGSDTVSAIPTLTAGTFFLLVIAIATLAWILRWRRG